MSDAASASGEVHGEPVPVAAPLPPAENSPNRRRTTAPLIMCGSSQPPLYLHPASSPQKEEEQKQTIVGL